MTEFVRLHSSQTNSIKKTNEGCISVCLDVVSLGSDANVDQVIILRIADTGVGIPQDFIDNRLFVPFSQVNQLDSGLGLGLPIVKQTVDALGGNIQVDSDETTGTTVIVTLPWSGSQELKGMDVKRASASLFDASLPITSKDLPALYAQLRPSSKWSDSDRGRRCADLIWFSLTRSLRNTVQTQLDSWRPETVADIIIVFGDDVDVSSATNEHGDQPMLILGSPALGNERRPHQNLNRISPQYVVSKTLTPSKLRRAFETLFPDRFAQRQSSAIVSPGLSRTLPPLNTAARAGRTDEDSTNASDDSLLENFAALSETRREISPVPGKGLPEIGSRPRLLLVDDNAINLRVLVCEIRLPGWRMRVLTISIGIICPEVQD